MVHFEPNDQESARGEKLAPVAYLPGAFGAAPVDSDGASAPDPADANAVTNHRATSATARKVARLADRRDVFPSVVPEVATSDNWAVDADTEPEFADYDGDDEEGSDDDDEEDEEVEFDPVAEREHAESLLLARLRSRSLSVVEATAVLAATDVSEEDIDDILTRFADLNYLDDNKLADQIIHTHHSRKGLGRSGVEAEMRRRKLDQFVILEKLDELPDEEIERATELALTRVRQLSRVDDQTADRRLTGFLLRKGYSSAAVRAAVKSALATRLGSGRTSTVRFQ